MAHEIPEGSENCTFCGRPLDYSPDDQPYWPTGPMCGDCYQSRQMDDEIFWAADTELDSDESVP